MTQSPHQVVSREAKLFEAGEYPDKGVTVRAEDLARLAQQFKSPVPLLIEHAESPLALGSLTKVRAEGDELFGTVELTDEANRLIEASGADSLSIGLSPDLAQIVEVSLVNNPRVPSARLFYGPVFHTKLPTGDAKFWRDRAVEADRRWREVENERQINEWLVAGRLVPAQVPVVRELLTSPHAITFDGKTTAVSVLVSRLIDSFPEVARFAETASSPAQTPTSLTPDHADFYRRHFPDLSLEEIAKRTG